MGKFTGKVIYIGELRSGTAQSGKEWATQELVIEELNAEYPQTLVGDVWGKDKVEHLNVKQGDIVSCTYNLKGRQYNGRWYGDISISNIKVEGNGLGISPDAVPTATPVEQSQANAANTANDSDVLPF